ncbi:MAG: flagellar hook protein FlgE [Desulfosarcina sp.]|nr:flagellar hook protein FlgE [Desulfosarcina sp.]MBC2742085.1 flagellar hook protein FlgE [Desulfosarcina sp.]MBC2764998.1 flagellar hook protein FlgE [Desulfosarcina sp.]
MIGSLYSGISGLKANTSAMAVIGDNIANVDTTGFKSSRVSFANIFSASLSQTSVQIGRGVMLNGVNPQWEAGSLENTNSATDLSINGTGLFMVSDPNDGISYYTRAGNFDWDKDGNLMTPDGFVVQGYNIDPTTGAVGGIGDIVLPNGTSAPNPTQNISFGMNLDSGSAVGDTFTSSITTYDSLGSEAILDIELTRTAASWDWTVSVNHDNPAASSASTGSIAFDVAGNLDPASSVPPNANPTIQLDNIGPATSPMAITWNYLDGAGASDGSITGYSSESSKTAQSQDGYPSGNLQSVSVNEDGYFTGIYSNGSMIPFAQLALADFPSYSGLAKQGSNLYAESLASGQPLLGPPNSASFGSIAPSTLEMSNVDLGTEFVEMITTQRAFQANSKVITTSDEILAELLNIKR